MSSINVTSLRRTAGGGSERRASQKTAPSVSSLDTISASNSISVRSSPSRTCTRTRLRGANGSGDSKVRSSADRRTMVMERFFGERRTAGSSPVVSFAMRAFYPERNRVVNEGRATPVNHRAHFRRPPVSHFFCEPFGDTFHRDGAVEFIEDDVDEREGPAVGQRRFEGVIERALRFDFEASPSRNDLRQAVVGPFGDVVVRSVVNLAFGRVSVVVQDDDDRRKAEPLDGGEFHAGHLKRAVSDEDERPQMRVCQA